MKTVLILAIVISLTNANNDSSKNKDGCGVPNGAFLIQNRIVGGYDVGYYKYPWFAALIRDGIVNCGGTLIGPKTVLSAAHCFKDAIASTGIFRLEDYYTVKLGIYNNCISEKTQQTFTIQKVHVHELFKTKDPYYDISLITLRDSAKEYTPICLPKIKVSKRPKEGTVPGLGRLKYNGSTPCTLHEARLLIYSDQACSKMLQSAAYNPKELSHAFCAGYLSGQIDACQGDSGGPLQVLDENGYMVLLGIVSFGFDCAVKGYLGLYTDVSHFLGWIQEKLGSDFPTKEQMYPKYTTVTNIHISTSIGSASLVSGTSTEVSKNASQIDGDIQDIQNVPQVGDNPPIYPSLESPNTVRRPINIIIIQNRGSYHYIKRRRFKHPKILKHWKRRRGPPFI